MREVLNMEVSESNYNFCLMLSFWWMTIRRDKRGGSGNFVALSFEYIVQHNIMFYPYINIHFLIIYMRRSLISTTIPYNNKLFNSGMGDLKCPHGNILVMPVSGVARLKPSGIVTCFVPSWWQWCLRETRREKTKGVRGIGMQCRQTKLTFTFKEPEVSECLLYSYVKEDFPWHVYTPISGPGPQSWPIPKQSMHNYSPIQSFSDVTGTLHRIWSSQPTIT